jgi:RNA polymerase sigma-70 factor (ECF subfamily)
LNVAEVTAHHNPRTRARSPCSREAWLDVELVERARRGDRDAFAQLVPMVTDRLYAIAFRILRDPELAQDALQNALVTAWRQVPKLRDPAKFDGWINRVIVTSCYIESRRHRRYTADVHVLAEYEEPLTADTSRDSADRDELERAFRRLPLDQRSVFVLHHYVGLPLVEVAETLGIPAGTARSRLHYATRSLRSAVEADRRATPGERRTA